MSVAMTTVLDLKISVVMIKVEYTVCTVQRAQVYFTLFGKLKCSMHFLVKKYFLRIFYKRIFFLNRVAFAANWFYFTRK
jgi:hypothetical protein